MMAGLLAVTQAGGAPAATPDANSIKIQSVWDFVIKGGPTMVAIGLCSLVALTVIVERIIVLRRRAVVPPQFLATLGALGSDRDKSLALCEADASPVAKVLTAIIRHRGQPAEAVEKAVRAAGGRVLVKLRHRMRLLSALPQVSTMLGLLGTIFGMIKTFQAVATSGQSLGKTETLAKGIFEAWTNTAAGLLVAIPVLIAYHILMGRIDAMAAELDRVATEWMERESGVMAVVQPVSMRVHSASSPEPAGVAAPNSAIALAASA